ncbi:MAG: PorT family protein [Bacteroidetes bacterium]|nr:PorT family protein [Bacteroidota bacterium]
MKKLVTMMTMVLVITASAIAQKKVGVKAGLNLNHVTTNNEDLKSELSARPSIHLGLVGDFSLGKDFAFQPQLLFSGRGGKVEHDDHKDVYAFNSLEIPLNFVYRPENKAGFFAGAGPVLGYNLSGKEKAHDESEKIEFGTEAGTIKRFDVGANALLGYQLSSGVFFSANYMLGFTNWNNVENPTWRNNMFAVSVGYFFNKAKK